MPADGQREDEPRALQELRSAIAGLADAPQLIERKASKDSRRPQRAASKETAEPASPAYEYSRGSNFTRTKNKTKMKFHKESCVNLVHMYLRE